jgi:hypothetical protein
MVLHKGSRSLRLVKVTVAFIVALAVIGLFVTLLDYGAIVSAKRVKSKPFQATANIGIYTDSSCTQNATSIDWGTITAGDYVTRTLYIKNLGNAQVTLSLSTTNWTPTTANGPITLTWNRENTALAINKVTTATLTLNISSIVNGITTFEFEIVISGTAS